MTTLEDNARHYQSFEGNSSGLTSHLLDVHGITSPFDRPLVDQGGYLTLDLLHRQAHETRPADDLDDAHQALAELVHLVVPGIFSHNTKALIERCRPLLEPSEAEATLAEIRKLRDQYAEHVSIDIVECEDHDAYLFWSGVNALLDPPPRPIEVNDTVTWTGDERRWTEENADLGPCPAWEEAVVNDVTRVVLAVNYSDGTLDITDSKANFINVPAHQCTRKEES